MGPTPEPIRTNYDGQHEHHNPDRVLLFGVTEAATVLGIGGANVYGLLKTGELQSVKIGGRRLIPRAALQDFVARLADPS